MVVFAIVDLVTGYFGKDLVIQEFIYNSFVFITLGSFANRVSRSLKEVKVLNGKISIE